MKSLTWLFDCMLRECSIRCGTDTQRDIITISRRTKHEGISFLTITLPSFCKDFESCLSKGFVDSTDFRSFRKSGSIPALLQGMTSQVFHPTSGVLLDNASEEAISCIRQICLMCKKVLLPCSIKRERKSFDAYIKNDEELAGTIGALAGKQREVFRQVSRYLWSGTLDLGTELVLGIKLYPRHGPGQTAEHISGNGKYVLSKWHARLQPLFPFDAYGHPSPEAPSGVGGYDEIEFLEPEAETPVRVVSVPKTLTSTRIIAIEPVCMQYIQQALAHPIMKMIERAKLTAGHINFSDQKVNRKLAQEASRSGFFATIDLSDASDRVSKDLVWDMLESVPVLRDAIFACRSTRADVNGSVIELNKFASMGSALCFPIESMVFFTLCVLARLTALNLQITPRNVFNVSRSVYIYGDDIIVPAGEVPTVALTLSTFGLKVNQHKTFWTGKFRESCGMDAYNGVDVTPVYLRTMPPRNRQNASEFVSFVSFANQLYKKGWWTTARRVREQVESIFGLLPHVQETSPCQGWHSYNNTYVYRKLDSLCRPVVKGYVVRPVERNDPLEGYGALMKFFLKVGEDPIFGEHLRRTVRPGSVRIKYRWAPAF